MEHPQRFHIYFSYVWCEQWWNNYTEGFPKEKDQNFAARDLVAKSAFAEMDVDQDGKVTIAEFIAVCLGQEEFCKMLVLKVIDIFVEDDS